MASKTLAGHRLTGPGEHPIVMVFFASWCGHCKRELSTLGQLRDEYPEIRIIGLNAYEEFRGWSDKERLKAYLDANAPWLQEVVHADKQMLRDFGGIPKIPSLFVYDRRGQLVAEFRRNKRRLPSPDELEQSLLAALNKE
jgi:thiol-disulfide isomerase/thioredoxin